MAETTGGRRSQRHVTQVALVSLAIAGYFTARGLTESDPTRAVGHASQVVSLERWVHLYQEPRLQALVVSHDKVVTVLNWIYIWLHWPVIVAVLIWLVRSQPGPYRLLRNAMFVSGVIGLIIFTLYPVAPPRLAGLGLADTVTSHSHAYRVLQPPAFVNQYAALPSLHVGWNLLLGIFLVRHSRHVVLRLFGLLSPVAMAVAVVLTANHFLVDVVGGAGVALVGLYLAARLSSGDPGTFGPGPGSAGDRSLATRRWSGLTWRDAMPRLPHDVTDLHLAPVLLALDARLSEMSLLDTDELVQRVAIESDRPDWSEDMRRSGLLASVQHCIDLRGWELSWDPRGLQVRNGHHHVVLGVPSNFEAYIHAAPSPLHV